MKSFRHWSRSRQNIDRDGNLYNIARYTAHQEGIKITDKSGLNGYRLSESMDGQICAELMFFDEMCGRWSQFDVDWFDTMEEARESARGQMSNLIK